MEFNPQSQLKTWLLFPMIYTTPWNNAHQELCYYIIVIIAEDLFMPKKIISTIDNFNKNLRVLSSEEEFEHWYKEQYDFSMFSEEEIKQAIQEERPENYPCIPLVIKDDNALFYLSKELILYCVGRIFDKKG
ncbi:MULTISPECIES: hypothetical protein [Enterobacter]|jgi:hypothetical protein|uniref:hypothetical protein n=1 Tax=Enterobacter TaxID=547 RepID=UPI00109DB3B4|nr:MULTISPECIES: hypothetical protein [unclassified Enterobacter]MCK7256919.1 hypothetical protein [Enterobacter asburiae]THC28606.1 hypothetical protein E3V94_09280 [Enterobacter sp. AD2-3]BBJ66352.1 hypothetical protein ECC18A13_009170 [Enterobacter sp. 18A13]